MKVYVLIRQRDEVCFGHYNQSEINEMVQNGWRIAHYSILEKWPKPDLKIYKPKINKQIGVNKHGFPIYA